MTTPVSAATPASAMNPTATATDMLKPEPPHQPEPADQRERQRQHDDERLGEAAEVEVEQQEDDHQRHRHHHAAGGLRRARRYSNWPLHTQIDARRKLHLLGHRLPRVGDVAAKVAVADVDVDVGGELWRSRCGCWSAPCVELDVGDLAQRHRAAVLGSDTRTSLRDGLRIGTQIARDSGC